MWLNGCFFEQPFIPSLSSHLFFYSRRKVVGKVAKAKVITGKTTNRRRETSVARMCLSYIGMTQFQLVKLIWVHMFGEQLVCFLHRMVLKTWRYHRFTKKTPSCFQLFFPQLLGNFPFNLSLCLCLVCVCHTQTHTHWIHQVKPSQQNPSLSLSCIYNLHLSASLGIT